MHSEGETQQEQRTLGAIWKQREAGRRATEMERHAETWQGRNGAEGGNGQC